MKTFFNDHFTPLLLAVLIVLAWAGTMHLIRTPGIAVEDRGWAREEVGVLIGALIMVLTGMASKVLPSKKNEPPDDKET